MLKNSNTADNNAKMLKKTKETRNKKFFTKTTAFIVIVLLLAGNLTINILQYIHTVNNPVTIINQQPIIGSSGGVGDLGGNIGITSSSDETITVETPEEPNSQGINGVEVNEENFIGEEQFEGEK